MGNFGFWETVQLLIIMLVVAWFFKVMRMPSKFTQRQNARREEMLERRRRRIDEELALKKEATKEEEALKQKEKN